MLYCVAMNKPTNETEGKWLLSPEFDRRSLQKYPHTDIAQGYIAHDQNGTTVRVRHEKSHMYEGLFTLNVKGKKSAGSGSEFEKSITQCEFWELWPLTEGRRVEKRRYICPLVGAYALEDNAAVDVFSGRHEGLVVVEVEVASKGDLEKLRTSPPDWFGLDVTDDPRYSNVWLASHGIPPLADS